MKLKNEHLVFIPIFLIVINMILVVTGKILPLDNWVYSLITHKKVITDILLFITKFGSVSYIVIICIFLLIFYKQKKELMHLYGVVIISTVINNIIKIIFRRARPALMGSFVPVFENTFSFPSGHAMATMTFYGFLIYMIYRKDINKKLKGALIGVLSVLILAVGFSRIYLYVHYFSDVFTGFMCSLVILYYYVKKVMKIDIFNFDKKGIL